MVFTCLHSPFWAATCHNFRYRRICGWGSAFQAAVGAVNGLHRHQAQFLLAFVYDVLRYANGQYRGPGGTIRLLMEHGCNDWAIDIRRVSAAGPLLRRGHLGE